MKHPLQFLSMENIMLQITTLDFNLLEYYTEAVITWCLLSSNKHSLPYSVLILILPLWHSALLS